jgi:ribosome biogenesis GTPase A
MQQFQWYPGHMTKARRAMQESIKLIDLVIEIVDARVPQASRNPDIDTLGNGKARMVILNKVDLADDKSTRVWAEHFKKKGYHVLTMDSRVGSGKKQVNQVIAEACKEKIERDRKRGILNRPVRAMVAGIPNVGKSTFINTMAGKAAAKTGNKPGVTRGNQWIRLHKNVELLDTPGILWPKFEDQKVGLRLAYIGSIKDELFNIYELSILLLDYLKEYYPEAVASFYQIEQEDDSAKQLELVAARRGCMKAGGVYDVDKAAKCLVDDFRAGRLGAISLETPDMLTE